MSKVPACPTCATREWTREAPIGSLAPDGGIVLDQWRCANNHVASARLQRTLARLSTHRLGVRRSA